ncbi:MAG TPA: hypothetical protein VFK65_08720 [Candidatus Binatia bacterium]|nr:hypothetical protein [Candidatus Binatia bacterium]
MIRAYVALLGVIVVLGLVPARALAQISQTSQPTACGVITAEDAQKFVGGPLDVKEQPNVPINNAPGAYNSVCTYIARGVDVDKALTAPRLLDLTLHFLDSRESMATIYENSVITYTQFTNTPDPRFKNPSINYLGGFGDKAFVFEAITDPQSDFKSALIVFYKGRIGGSIAAWKKPEPALETSKAVLKHILSRLP